MRRSLVAPAAAALLGIAGLGAAGRQGGDEPLTVRAVRFYQPASGTTTIEGVCELRLAAMTSGAMQTLRYRFEVAVLDSTGLELQRSGWTRDVAASVARARGATAMESFGFAAAPGTYRVQVQATPEGGGGSVQQRTIEIRAFSGRPPISDLLLATGRGRSVSDTEQLAPGEFRRAGLAMRTAPVPRLSPTDAALSYYAEVYPSSEEAASGQLRVEVLGDSGRIIVATPPRPVEVSARGGVTRGQVDLTGLPEGPYRLRLLVRLGDSSLVTEAPFRMGPLTAVAENVAASTPPADDPFVDASEARLDSLYAPLSYILDSRTEGGVYDRLSVDGKRRFLREFWRRRDPTPGDADNPAMRAFYNSVNYANSAFTQGRVGGMAGWRTDRGRVYLKYGRPDDMLRRPMASPYAFEVWKYTRDRAYWYVFVDRNGLGDYLLVGTNDRREPGLQEFYRYLSPDSQEEASRFLGVQTLIDRN